MTLIAVTLALAQSPSLPAYHVGASGPVVLVVGCIHGSEPAGIAVAQALRKTRPVGEQLWIVPSLNPAGVRRGTRQNEHGVDLNRNFGSLWRRLGRPGDLEYSGPRPWSEPETRWARSLVLRIHPAVTIWFHQPQSLVRAWGRSILVAKRYARLSGMSFRALAWPNGSASSWQNHLRGGGESFVVELPPGRLSAAAVARQVRAVLGIAREP
jgi:protein MpaA